MEVKELIQQILVKAYEISKNTRHDVFVKYAGHTNSLDVFYYDNGFEKEKDFVWIEQMVFLNFENPLKKLERILKKLEELEDK